ncbi:MAG: protein O-mannosyl-transferase, partial [Candidatus Binatota bacterium]|nr:protein O-mannosyl-transferase [Candidatus Binatota bacterium]
AALFAFHPMHAFAATQVKARSDVLFACFYLLALLAYEHAWRGRRDAPHPGALALAAGLSLLSVLSKEMGVTLPLALLVLHALWIVRDGMPVRAVVWTAPFWMVLAGYAAFRFGALGLWPARVGYGDVYSAPVLYLNLTKNVTIHLLRMLVPHGADYPELFPTLSNVIDPTLHDPQIHLSIALIVLLIGVAVALRERAPVVAFGIAFFLVSLAPLARVENIAGAISVTHIPAQERFAYLPSIGIFLLIAAGGAALHGAAGRRRRILYAAAGLALLVALARMASVHALSADSWLALLKQYALVPEERLTRLDRVNQLILYAQMVSMPRGELADAEERTRAAVRLAPDSPMPAVALSNVLAAAGRWSDVAEVLEPWQSPADARLREMQHTNFRIADDLNRTSTYVAYLSGRALAHTGHADAAAERLCRALASGFDLASIRSALHENEALNGAPHCIDAADPGRCIAEAPGTLPPDDVRRCGSAE